MSYRWKQIKKCLDIGDEKYHKSDQRNTLLKKNDSFLQLYKYMSIKI